VDNIPVEGTNNALAERILNISPAGRMRATAVRFGSGTRQGHHWQRPAAAAVCRAKQTGRANHAAAPACPGLTRLRRPRPAPPGTRSPRLHSAAQRFC